MDFAEMALDEAIRDSEIGPNKPLMDIWFIDENIGLAVGASGYICVLSMVAKVGRMGQKLYPAWIFFICINY
uniref:hypothetical protein n=1 Tax=Comamonas sp. 7D-2 TaxID=1232667 RepID=UPI001565C467|nr:hypothetical protein [Comamonas sp. 7D-2]